MTFWLPRTHYDMLEVDREASPEDIKRARDVLMQVWHPDRFKTGTELYTRAEVRAKAIVQAYECLRDPAKRRAYDRTLPSAAATVLTFPDPMQNRPDAWKRMAAWMKDENVGSSFQRRIVFKAGDLLERRLQPTDKQRPYMLDAWQLAIEEGFDPAASDE